MGSDQNACDCLEKVPDQEGDCFHFRRKREAFAAQRKDQSIGNREGFACKLQ